MDPEPASPYRAVRRRIGRWMDASRYQDVSGGRARIAYRVAIFLYATLVYAVLLGLAVGGVALVVLAFPNPFLIVVGAIMVGAAYVARPRVSPMPEGLLAREELPALYGLADQVADAIGAGRIDAVVLTDDFNAYMGRFGWRRRAVVGLGLPLFTVLDGPQRVALLGHEIAHDVNGDPVRGAYVGYAYRAVLELHGLLQPMSTSLVRQMSSRSRRAAEVGLAGTLTNLVMRTASLIARPIVVAFEVLMRRESQRAEYEADAISAEVAGSDAARALLRTLHLVPTLAAGVWTLVARGDDEDVFGVLRRRVADTPAREWERLDRAMALDETQLDASKPPTSQRIRVIESRAGSSPRVTISLDEQDAIERELLAFEPRFSRALFELARDSLYRH